MNILRHITGLLFFCQPLLLFAQLSFSPTVFSPETGHPTKYASSIAEDKNGLIWLSSRSGLYRFDGEFFISIDEVNGDLESLADTDIRYMEYLPESHELWILPFQTDYLLVLNIETFELRKLPLPTVEDGRREHVIFKKDVRDNLLISIFTGTKHHLFKISPADNFQRLFALESESRQLSLGGFDDRGQLYISSLFTKGVIKIDTNDQERQAIILDSTFTENGLKYFNFNPHIGLKKDYHWLPGQNKIVSSDHNNDNYTVLADLSNLSVSETCAIKLKDQSENLWLICNTFRGKETILLRISASGEIVDFSPVLEQTKLKYDAIPKIIEDNSRNIWIVTNQGLIRFTNPQNLFEHYFGTNQAPYFSSPRSIVADEQGNLYCNVRDEHLVHRIHAIEQEEQATAVLFPDIAANLKSTLPVWFSLLKIDTTQHTIWYLVPRGRLVAFRYLTDALDEFSIKDLLGDLSNIPGFCLLPNSHLILGNHLGSLVYFNTTTYEQKHLSLPLSEDKQYIAVKNIINGPDGSVWVGSRR